MTILSLKGTLMYCLNRVLFSEHEASSSSFINFLQDGCSRFELLLHTDLMNQFPQGATTSTYSSASWRKIPLQKKQNVSGVLYTSALPQILFSRTSSAASLEGSKEYLEFSKSLAHLLRKRGFELMNCERDHNEEVIDSRWLLWNEFVIETQRPGWIAFRLSKAGIALWLKHVTKHYDNQSCINDSFACSSADDEVWSELIWQVQHTYARCCTLLRLWQQVHLYTDDGRANRDAFRRSASGARAADFSQMRLVHQLIAIADDMADAVFWIPYQCPSEQYFLLLKRAAQLCQSLKLFHGSSLSGFSQNVSAPSANASTDASSEYTARFHLVAVTKDILETLLRQYFNAEAPISL